MADLHQMRTTVRGLICDLDGVLRHWPAAEMKALEAQYDLPEGAVHAVAFAPNLLSEAVTGTIADSEWRRRVAHRLTSEYGPAAAEAVHGWSAIRPSIDGAMLELLGEVRRTCPVALLTNATTRLADDLAAAGLTNAFDAIVNSSDVGLAKPDPGVFHQASAAIGLTCSCCAFVDDTASHVEAASRTGLVAILHQSVERTRRALVELGLLQPEDECGSYERRTLPQ